MTTDLDALIAEARGWASSSPLGKITAREVDRGIVFARRLADALESTLAELRQERERADEAANHAELALAGRRNAVDALARERERADELRELSRRWQEVVNAPDFVAAVEAEARGYHDSACRHQAALSRAEETIEKVRNLPRHELNALVTAVDAHDIDAILTEHDKRKEK